MNNILTILISFVVEFANLSFNQFYFIFLFAPVVLLFFVHKNILINLEFFECVVKLYCYCNFDTELNTQIIIRQQIYDTYRWFGSENVGHKITCRDEIRNGYQQFLFSRRKYSKCSRASTNATLIARFVTAKTITTVLYRGGSAHRCGKIPIFQIIAVVYIYRTSSAILTRSHEGN